MSSRCQNLTIGRDYDNNLSATLLSHSIKPLSSHCITHCKCTHTLQMNECTKLTPEFVGTKESPRIPSHLIYFKQASTGAPSDRHVPSCAARRMPPEAPQHACTPPLHPICRGHTTARTARARTEKRSAGSRLQGAAPKNTLCRKPETAEAKTRPTGTGVKSREGTTQGDSRSEP